MNVLIYVAQYVSINIAYLEIRARVRYWEDGEINGVYDTEGLMPGRENEHWHGFIDIADGKIMEWPPITASIHYKVCDEGEYWLCNESRTRLAKWGGDYVPDTFFATTGGGDYISFDVSTTGLIDNWPSPPHRVDGGWDMIAERIYSQSS